jgi:flagellar basal body-associated protein FliL
MENNENNFKNEVKDVENNVNNAPKKEKKIKKGGKVKVVLLAILVLILFLLVGIIAGMMISGNNKPEFIKQIEDKITKQENKDSKKIDESKPWVYDAEYLNGRTDKTRENYKASRDLIAPFININSDDAKKANEDIKALYEELYGKFTENLEVSVGVNQEKVVDGSVYAISKINYEYIVKDNILSILLIYDKGAVPADVSRSYKTYNFNLDTLKFASLEEVGKVCGFNSESEIKEKINIAMENAGEEAGIFDDTVWDEKRFFVNKNGKLNIVLPGPALGEITLEVDKDAKKVDNTTNSGNENKQQIKNYSQDNFMFLNAAGFKNVTYESKKDENGPNYKVEFDEKGNPTITIVLLGEGIGSQIYETYNSFYSIVQSNNWPESGIETASFKFKDLNGTGSEQTGVIKYSLVTNNETIELKMSVPYGEHSNKEITLYKANKYIRPDNTNRSSGELMITNFTNESFDFEINATHVNGEDINESIARGGINLGEVSGTAKKVSEGKYQFVPDENEELMKYFESEYKIEFNIKDDNSIEVKEIYDDAKYNQGPYAGAGVRFTGVYSK